jgi:hypothetical protein
MSSPSQCACFKLKKTERKGRSLYLSSRLMSLCCTRKRFWDSTSRFSPLCLRQSFLADLCNVSSISRSTDISSTLDTSHFLFTWVRRSGSNLDSKSVSLHICDEKSDTKASMTKHARHKQPLLRSNLSPAFDSFNSSPFTCLTNTT